MLMGYLIYQMYIDGYADGQGMVETGKGLQISGFWKEGKLSQNSLTFISLQNYSWNIFAKEFLIVLYVIAL